VADSAPEVVLDGFTFLPRTTTPSRTVCALDLMGGSMAAVALPVRGDWAPGTPTQERIPLRGTIWRLPSQRKVFEALSCGTTNPWGHDWNEARRIVLY